MTFPSASPSTLPPGAYVAARNTGGWLARDTRVQSKHPGSPPSRPLHPFPGRKPSPPGKARALTPLPRRESRGGMTEADLLPLEDIAA